MFTNKQLNELKELHRSPFHSGYCLICQLLSRLDAAEAALAQTKTFRQYAHNMFTLCQQMPRDIRREGHIHECWEFEKALQAWRKTIEGEKA